MTRTIEEIGKEWDKAQADYKEALAKYKATKKALRKEGYPNRRTH